MKKITITSKLAMGVTVNGGNTVVTAEGGEDVQVSDGFHTMHELYDHRITLFIALCRNVLNSENTGFVWRSKVHSDGSSFDGWFILGINKQPGEQITYHLPLSRWSETDFVYETLEKAPEFDGHTSADVFSRLKSL